MIRGPRVRLWVKLAAFAALGVVVTHGFHLFLTDRISSQALTRGHEAHGRSVARVLAHHAADAILVSDVMALQDLMDGAVAGGDVAYCFVVRDGRVLASSYRGRTPPALVSLRDDGGPADEAIVVRSRDEVYLDVDEPVLEGSAGHVRLGMAMGVLRSTRIELALFLGLAALAMILLGVAAALVVGRRITRPVRELVDAAQAFDPADEVRPVRPRGSDEIAEITVRFNEMMARLKRAYEEEERARQKNQQTERLVALGSLVAGVAHEVNNPLAGIMNCHHRLRREDLPERKRREYLDLMKEGFDRIQDVVQRLLEFGRPRPLVLSEVPIRELAREAGQLLRSLLAKRGIALSEELDGAPAELRAVADRRQIAQALLNLLLNAAYATADGGEIRLRARRRAGMCGLAVEDDGPGVPPEIRDRILDPFFSTKPEGTGLGLSVTRSIVGAHGGELTFEFPEGGGTVATIWLREGGELCA